MNATTDGSGNYQFTEVPALKTGEKYNVAYSNQERNDTRLWRRQSFALNSFAGGSVFGGDFDVQNIYHQSPGSGAVLTLPVKFCWSRRSVATDNYYFVLHDPTGSLAAVWYNAGASTCYTLTALPMGYQVGVVYGWSIGVMNNSVDGYDWGLSYYYREITLRASALNAGNKREGSQTSSDAMASYPGEAHRELEAQSDRWSEVLAPATRARNEAQSR